MTTFTYDSALTTANPTQIQRSIDGTTNAVTNLTYLGNGNVSSVQDPNGNWTVICYDGNNLYPTRRAAGAKSGTVGSCASTQAKPEGRVTAMSYDFGSGVLKSETDEDNSITVSRT